MRCACQSCDCLYRFSNARFVIWLAGVSFWHAEDSPWLARSCSGWLDLLVSWQDVLPGWIMARVISRR